MSLEKLLIFSTIYLKRNTRKNPLCMRRIYLSGPGSSSAASWCVSPAAPAESWSQNCSDQGRRPNRTPRWSCPSCPHSSCFPRCRSRKAPPASSPRWSSSGVWAHLPGIQRRCRPPWGPSGRQLHLRCSSAVPEVMMCHGEVTQPDSPTAGSRRNLPAERKRSWQKRRSRPQNTRHDRICQLPKVPSRLSPPPCPFLNHWQTPQTISPAAVAVLHAELHFFQKGSRSCKVFLEEDRVPGALHYSAHKGKHRPTALTFLPHWPGLGYPVPPPTEIEQWSSPLCSTSQRLPKLSGRATGAAFYRCLRRDQWKGSPKPIHQSASGFKTRLY